MESLEEATNLTNPSNVTVFIESFVFFGKILTKFLLRVKSIIQEEKSGNIKISPFATE